jgi:phosphoribosylamine--glycine ligase
MVVTGTGPTIADAHADAYRLARRVVVPDVRYRNDIGAKLIGGDFLSLERLGLLQD